jgi:dTDP-glucose pyrophosphorylase
VDLVTAVVLARGAGRRMREVTNAPELTAAQVSAAAAGRKAMMPMGERTDARPFLDYVIGSLARAGCTRACLVIAPEQHDVRQRYVSDAPPERLEVVFAEQMQPRGTAHAVLAAESVVANQPFLVVNADNLYPVAVLRSLVTLDGPGLPAFTRAELVASSNIPHERVRSFAVIEADEAGWLRRILEKPSAEVLEAGGQAALISMNAWRFDARIFEACRDVPISTRGEYELPEAVALALSRGVKFRVIPARGPVLDLSRASDIADVSRRLAGMEPGL